MLFIGAENPPYFTSEPCWLIADIEETFQVDIEYRSIPIIKPAGVSVND